MSQQNDKCIYFFIGTEAELIKIFPVILRVKELNIAYKIISSGQNDISKSTVLKLVNGGKIDILLSDSEKIKKSAFGLLSWFFKTYFHSKRIIKKEKGIKDSIMVVHGDTVSTVMGALLGHKYKMKVAHVEAGLRSFDLLNPFPEEIDRILTSKYARLYFAPNQLAFDNLKKMKGKKFNTQYNTILDSMRYSGTIDMNSKVFYELKDKKYFVFVMHRQENLVQKKLVQSVIEKIIDISKTIKCVMILHEITEIKMREYMLLDIIKKNDTITTTPRMEYFDFIKLLRKSEFVITDGGSNQEELYYMGKPCLVLRKKTERNEGINKNVLMYNEDIGVIKDFSENYNRYKTNGVDNSVSPSDIIAKILLENIL